MIYKIMWRSVYFEMYVNVKLKVNEMLIKLWLCRWSTILYVSKSNRLSIVIISLYGMVTQKVNAQISMCKHAALTFMYLFCNGCLYYLDVHI